ncbi:MAG: iron ABC transporter permease [Wenzhouxiangellaceae bacterium]
MSRTTSWWPWITGVLVAALALPVVVVLAQFLVPAGDTWRHLADTVLTDYLSNSLLLTAGVGLLSLTFGVSAAWLVAMCDFPGRRWYEWALLLPLAMPAYIIAYTYTGMLDFAGPLQSQLRELTGWGYGDYWFPQVRSLSGATILLALVLYPYVYMLVRAAFVNQSLCVLEVSRSLGHGPWRTFFRLALPLARPAIIGGVSLAMMEALADYGTVQYFGIATFTTGIFRTWYGLGDLPAAAQLAAVLMIFVLVLITLERLSRRQARFHHTSQRLQALRRIPLTGWRGLGAILVCLLLVAGGFLIPAGQLIVWAIDTAPRMLDQRFIELIGNTLYLAAVTALIALLLALILGYAQRLQRNRWVETAVRVASMGYAVPGMVIAVGVMIPFAWFDRTLDEWMRQHWQISTGLLLSGTLIALVFAYLVRFLAVSLNTVEAGLNRLTPSMDEAARSLGLRSGEVLRRVHIPLLRGSLLTAILLVFIDVLKELPATLILRPFNFNTLAVRAFELAGDERLADASSPALAIVIAGLLPVILLSRAITHSRMERND